MIQRIQSIFLLLAAILMIGTFFFPLWQKIDFETSEMATVDVDALRYESFDSNNTGTELIFEKTTIYIAILVALSTLTALFSIFQYKNRLRQIQLGALNSFLIAATMFTTVYFVFKAEKMLVMEIQGDYEFGFYFPIVALFCNYLANRFIRKDEKLVRSADRIR